MSEFKKSISLFKSLRESFIPATRFYLLSASTTGWLPKLSRFINRKLYKLGLGAALNRYDNSWTLYSSAADARLYSRFANNDVFCNFGSGAFFHYRWRNYDFPGQSKYYQAVQGLAGRDYESIDLCAANLQLPLADNSVALIYCSHTLEHLESDRAIDFLRECYRVMKPGALMRLAVPSTDNDQRILSIVASQIQLSDDVKQQLALEVSKHLLTDSVHHDGRQLFTLMQLSDFDARKYYESAVEMGINAEFSVADPGRHISYWDYVKLNEVARDLSFRACIPCYRGVSLEEPFLNLHVFDTTEPHVSLYIELVK